MQVALALENMNRLNKRQIREEFKVDELIEEIEALDQQEEEEEKSVSTEVLVKKLPKIINLDRHDKETPSNSTGAVGKGL
jgi:hypothetical protein